MRVLGFALLGLGVGGAYAISALGIVFVYRASRVVNFAQPALMATGAYVSYGLRQAGFSVLPALILGICASAVVGALIYVLIMHPLRAATDLIRLVAILGALLVVTNAIALFAGSDPLIAPHVLPTTQWHLGAGVSIGIDRICIIVIGGALTLATWAVFRWSHFGLRTRAVAESELTFRSLGYSAARVSLLNWGLGGALGGLAGILLASITGLSPTEFESLLLPTLAACLIARFESVPLAFGAALLIGALSSEVTFFAPDSGLSNVVPLLVVIAVLLFRGQGLPSRDAIAARLPTVGGRGPTLFASIPIFLVVAYLVTYLPLTWAGSVTTTAATALVFLSVVVITGYAGQLSLGQFAVAGCAALLVGKLSGGLGLPLLLVLPAVVLMVLPLGLVLGIPSFRTRGANLAIATLALADVVQSAVLSNASITGGAVGTVTKPPEVFGLSMDPILMPSRYAAFAFLCLALAILVTQMVRRSFIARRWLAVRANERAAASIGVSVLRSKASALLLASGVAGLGGVIFAYSGPTVNFTIYDTQASINAVVLTMIGGIGFIAGAINGSLIASGGLITLLVGNYLGLSYEAVGLVAGLVVVVNAITAPSGAAYEVVKLRRARRSAARAVERVGEIERKQSVWEREAGAPERLVIEGVSVRFGGIAALSDASLQVCAGQVVGLIGPNGAGKSTLIDVVSGFTKPQRGNVCLGTRQLNRLSPDGRAKAGLARAFQSVELFDDLTILDNIRVASESRGPGKSRSRVGAQTKRGLFVPPACADALETFGMTDLLGSMPGELPFGQRRLASIARALACDPRFLLLDEPAAGLSLGERVSLQRLIGRLASAHGLGVLLVEHDVPLVLASSDEVVALNFGQVVAAGPPQLIRRHPKVVQSYLGQSLEVESAHEA